MPLVYPSELRAHKCWPNTHICSETTPTQGPGDPGQGGAPGPPAGTSWLTGPRCCSCDRTAIRPPPRAGPPSGGHTTRARLASGTHQVVPIACTSAALDAACSDQEDRDSRLFLSGGRAAPGEGSHRPAASTTSSWPQVSPVHPEPKALHPCPSINRHRETHASLLKETNLKCKKSK